MPEVPKATQPRAPPVIGCRGTRVAAGASGFPTIHRQGGGTMSASVSTGLIMIEMGLILLGAVGARTWLARHLTPTDIPSVLRHRIATIDRLHSIMLAGSAALVASGLGLVTLT